MDESDPFNLTNGYEPSDPVEAYPTPSFPAWVPAVTVAVGMMAFLAGSFYIRHRKVKKKREILMDYFYIIFQYGGMRRKRMVAALCNTNAITLRELGRSFMISFDSIANTENSCPFYLEETAFTSAQGPSPSVQKRTFFKSRGMGSSKKRGVGPFRRVNTQSQSEEGQHPNPVSFQDILMKFKTRRPHTSAASALSTPTRRRSVSPHLEGSSMCTIHGDEFDYQKYEEELAQYNRQRRNAYVIQYDTPKPKFADVVTEVGRRSLGSVMTDRIRAEQAPFQGKRNSEPWDNFHGGQLNADQSSSQGQSQGVFHVHGDRLAPSNVVCGSHGYIPKAYERSNSFQPFRNSEPTILIHPASIDVDSSQGWSDIRSKYTNGIVFLKRVPKGDDAPGEYYYEEQSSPIDPARRASLSKVSYVPSGNMNEYYNCFRSSSSGKSSGGEGSGQTEGLSAAKAEGPGPSRNKKKRMSLGEIAVSNFNRRIDMASESLPEFDPENSADSLDQQRQKPKTTWTRFKNVFTGSRAAQGTHARAKETQSVSVLDQRSKRRSRRQNTRWQRFFSVITGFRSLPETKKTEISVEAEVPKVSSSFPMGLDMRVGSSNDILETVELQSETEQNEETGQHSTDDGIRVEESELPEMVKQDLAMKNKRKEQRPTTLYLQSQTHSFPDDLLNGRQYYQRFRNVIGATRAMQPASSQFQRNGGRRYRKRHDQATASSVSLPQTRGDFSCYPFRAGYFLSQDEYRFKDYKDNESKPRAITPGRLEGNDDLSEPLNRRRVRSLSPLPERNNINSRKANMRDSKQSTNPDSVSENSLYCTPSDHENTTDVGNTHPIAVDISSQAEMRNQTHINISNTSQGRSLGASVHSCQPAYVRKNDHNSAAVGSDVNIVRGDADGASYPQPVQGRSVGHEATSPQPNTKIHSDIRDVPQTSYLKPEHRVTGCSNDSVYYDTVSQFGTPSPCDNEDRMGLSRARAPSPSPSGRSASPYEAMKRSEVTRTTTSSPSLSKRSASPHDAIRSAEVSRAPSPCNPRPDLSGAHPVSALHPLPPPDSRMPFPHALKISSQGEPKKSANPVSAGVLLHALPTPILSRQVGQSSSGRVDDMAGKAPNPDGFIQTLPYPMNQTIMTSAAVPFDGNNPPHYPSKTLLHAVKSDKSRYSGYVSPGASRPPSPARSMSSPVPPERSVSRQSGYVSPEEIYKANVARLPRFSRRASQSTSPPYDMVHGLGDQRYDNQIGTIRESNIDQPAWTEAAAATTTTSTLTTTVTEEGASHVQISPYDTLI